MLLPFALSLFITIGGVDVYTIAARQPIDACLSSCIWCGPPDDMICAPAHAGAGGCESPAWDRCVGTNATVQLAMTYRGPGGVWADFEHFAMDRGRPLRARLVDPGIFTDGFESGDTSKWTLSN